MLKTLATTTLQKIRRLFRRRRNALKPQPAPAEPTLPEQTTAIDDRPEFMKKIDRINALCEERKREMRMSDGGRFITEPPNEPTSRKRKEIVH